MQKGRQLLIDFMFLFSNFSEVFRFLNFLDRKNRLIVGDLSELWLFRLVLRYLPYKRAQCLVEVVVLSR